MDERLATRRGVWILSFLVLVAGFCYCDCHIRRMADKMKMRVEIPSAGVTFVSGRDIRIGSIVVER